MRQSNILSKQSQYSKKLMQIAEKNESNQLAKKQINHKITMTTFKKCFTFVRIE